MLSTDFVTGSPCWLDLSSPDTSAVAAFYRSVFGWDFESAGPEAGGYGFFHQDGKTVAALGSLSEPESDPAWTVYFQVSDADTTTHDAETSGGSVHVAPFDVMDAGRMSVLTDPGGADFSVWQPGTTKGLGLTSGENTLFWVELHVPDPAAALTFYQSLFGWRSQKMEVPGMTYTVLSTAEGDIQDASFGGIAPVQEGMDPRWLPYFHVADTDAAVSQAQDNGGSVLMPAADVPDVGRMAWVDDPFGAPFAVMKPAPTQG